MQRGTGLQRRAAVGLAKRRSEFGIQQLPHHLGGPTRMGQHPGVVGARHPHFGRVLAAYGGVFVAGSLLWGMAADGFRPDRWDVVGSVVCLVGVALIMYAPRG
jgi:hypothetical protein